MNEMERTIRKRKDVKFASDDSMVSRIRRLLNLGLSHIVALLYLCLSRIRRLLTNEAKKESSFISFEKAKKESCVMKETCVICYEDVETVVMFSVDKCGHRFCINCVKQHIEAKLLLDGKRPRCPQHGCKSKLSIDRCGELLTPKLSLTWKLMIREASIPFTEKVYCPYPKCSYLMTKTELSCTSVESGLRRCFKCGGSFCVHCKVPWHVLLTCADYKKYNRRNDYDVKVKSLAKRKGWKKCNKCQHMVERSSGCNYMQCRCGNVFCYRCGAHYWNSLTGHGHHCDRNTISCVVL